MRQSENSIFEKRIWCLFHGADMLLGVERSGMEGCAVRRMMAVQFEE